MNPEDKDKAAGASAAKPPEDGKSEATKSQTKEDEHQTLRERAIAAERKSEKLEKQIRDAEEEKLKEANKWQELATKRESENKNLSGALRRERIERIVVSVGKEAHEPEDLIPFIEISDEIDVSDLKALRNHISVQVEKLKKTKGYLFSQPKGEEEGDKKKFNTKVATNPAGSDTPTRITDKRQLWGLPLDTVKKMTSKG